MKLQDFLRELEELSKVKDNWYSVAGVHEKVKQCFVQPEQRRRAREAAAKAAGYSGNAMSRMLAVRTFFDSVRGEVKELDGVDPNTLSFPSLEIVKRLYQVSPEEGIDKLLMVANEEITYRDLQKRYNLTIKKDSSNASLQQMAKRDREDFYDDAVRSIHLSCEEMFESKLEMLTENFPLNSSLSIDAIARLTRCAKKENCVVGFEFVYPVRVSTSSNRVKYNFRFIFAKLIGDLLLKSHFFMETWVIFESSFGEERVNNFSRILDFLDRPSIGVAILPSCEGEEARPLKLIRRPTGGPSPDCREKLDLFNLLYRRLMRPTRQDEFPGDSGEPGSP